MGDFLITTAKEMADRSWQELDFVLISGDAYVDHPSFAPALIGRLLEDAGYRVGIIAQPDWKDTKEFMRLGKPRLASLVTAGNLDSMLNKRTAAKKIRNQDSYSPGGESGHRPDRATIVYANRMKEAYKDVPVIIGGVEASLRRFAHYDYWSDQIRRSILLDSKADYLIYGMGERQILELAAGLDKQWPKEKLQSIRGIVYAGKHIPEKSIVCPSYEAIKEDKRAFAEAFRLQYKEQDPFRGKTVVQPSGDRYIIQNPPALPLTEQEMDRLYELPYQRTWHPVYDDKGGVPAIEEVWFSLTSHRGCFGACSFCAITSHQGRIIQARSHESLLREAKIMTGMKEFKGYIHDVGGPTANFRHPSCRKQLTAGTCEGRHCMGSAPCPQIDTDHRDYAALLRKLRKLDKVKKVFVRSGIRYDYILADNNKAFVEELCNYHVSGHLKVAPEHAVDRVTDIMGKPGRAVFMKFKSWFDEANKKLGKQQYLVPYFMSSHPGCTLKDAVELAVFLKETGLRPEQVQDFIPTPGSLSTAMYYTGIHPLTGKKVFTAKGQKEKAMQRALMQFFIPANRDLVEEALIKAGRRDLIGFGPHCLIRPKKYGTAPNKRGRAGQDRRKKTR